MEELTSATDIKSIDLTDGIWSAYSERCCFPKDKLFETKSYVEFKRFCKDHSLILPPRKEVTGMACHGHYYHKGGWSKNEPYRKS